MSLAFASTKDQPQLLALDAVLAKPKNYTLGRVIDLKTKKETARTKLDEPGNFRTEANFSDQRDVAHAYFTSKAEPRAIFKDKITTLRPARCCSSLIRARAVTSRLT